MTRTRRASVCSSLEFLLFSIWLRLFRLGFFYFSFFFDFIATDFKRRSCLCGTETMAQIRGETLWLRCGVILLQSLLSYGLLNKLIHSESEQFDFYLLRMQAYSMSGAISMCHFVYSKWIWRTVLCASVLLHHSEKNRLASNRLYLPKRLFLDRRSAFLRIPGKKWETSERNDMNNGNETCKRNVTK